jgi:Protein of unknown function (DUF3617)
MKKLIVLGTLCLSTTLLLAQTQQQKPAESAPPPVKNVTPTLVPLNVKTGLWQMTETIAWTGLPPQMAAAMNNGHAINYKSCVKSQDLNSNPWGQGSGEHCRWTTASSNGTDMQVQGSSCQMGNGMTAQVQGTIHVIDSQDGTGSFDVTLTGNGQTMHGHASYTGKWLSATCPAGIN